MVSYTQKELLSITDFTKSLSKVLGDIKERTIEKVGVLKNNKLEAVVISTDEYERLKNIENMMETLEHKEVYDVVQERKNSSKEDYLSLEEMAKNFDINISEL